MASTVLLISMNKWDQSFKVDHLHHHLLQIEKTDMINMEDKEDQDLTLMEPQKRITAV